MGVQVPGARPRGCAGELSQAVCNTADSNGSAHSAPPLLKRMPQPATSRQISTRCQSSCLDNDVLAHSAALHRILRGLSRREMPRYEPQSTRAHSSATELMFGSPLFSTRDCYRLQLPHSGFVPRPTVPYGPCHSGRPSAATHHITHQDYSWP